MYAMSSQGSVYAAALLYAYEQELMVIL